MLCYYFYLNRINSIFVEKNGRLVCSTLSFNCAQCSGLWTSKNHCGQNYVHMFAFFSGLFATKEIHSIIKIYMWINSLVVSGNRKILNFPSITNDGRYGVQFEQEQSLNPTSWKIKTETITGHDIATGFYARSSCLAYISFKIEFLRELLDNKLWQKQAILIGLHSGRILLPWTFFEEIMKNKVYVTHLEIFEPFK